MFQTCAEEYPKIVINVYLPFVKPYYLKWLIKWVLNTLLLNVVASSEVRAPPTLADVEKIAAHLVELEHEFLIRNDSFPNLDTTAYVEAVLEARLNCTPPKTLRDAVFDFLATTSRGLWSPSLPQMKNWNPSFTLKQLSFRNSKLFPAVLDLAYYLDAFESDAYTAGGSNLNYTTFQRVVRSYKHIRAKVLVGGEFGSSRTVFQNHIGSFKYYYRFYQPLIDT